MRDAGKSRVKSVRLQGENYVLVSEINTLRKENAILKKDLHKAQADAAIAKSGQRSTQRQLKELSKDMSVQLFGASKAGLHEGATASMNDGAGYASGGGTLGTAVHGSSVASLQATSMAGEGGRIS